MKGIIKEPNDENEKLRMQLVACAVAANANTHECAAEMRDIHDDYKSGSWQSVCDAVDREMTLRDQRDRFYDAIAESFPLLDDNGLDADIHHCEWSIHQERKRLHALIWTFRAQGGDV